MRALVITEPGGPEVLEARRVPRPEPGAGQIRVRVLAFGVNRADLLQRRGRYPAPPGAPANIPGLEYTGEVDAVGPGVEKWAPGSRVMGIVGGGAYAEYVVVDEREAIEVPGSLSIEEAAAVPEAFLTAHDALFTQLGLRSGERLLIHAVLDLVGGPRLNDNLRCLAPRGRMVVVGLVAGASAEIDLGLLLRRRLTLRGTVLRSRSLEEKIAVADAFRAHALPLLAEGRIRPVLERVYPVTEIQAAHRFMEENRNFGKIVVRWR